MKLVVGQKAELKQIISTEMVESFAKLTGDLNPVHMSDEFAAKTMFKRRIAHGALVSSMISNVLANQLPGEGTIYLSQDTQFRAPVYLGDEVRCEVNVLKIEEKKVELQTNCYVDDKLVIKGIAIVLSP